MEVSRRVQQSSLPNGPFTDESAGACPARFDTGRLDTCWGRVPRETTSRSNSRDAVYRVWQRGVFGELSGRGVALSLLPVVIAASQGDHFSRVGMMTLASSET